MDYPRALEIVQDETAFPHDLSGARVFLAGHYAYLSGQLSEILVKKPAMWEEIRKTVASDTRAERLWAAMPEGVEETVLRMKLRAIDRMMSAVKTRIDVLSGEARNQQ